MILLSSPNFSCTVHLIMQYLMSVNCIRLQILENNSCLHNFIIKRLKQGALLPFFIKYGMHDIYGGVIFDYVYHHTTLLSERINHQFRTCLSNATVNEYKSILIYRCTYSLLVHPFAICLSFKVLVFVDNVILMESISKLYVINIS